MSGLLLCGKTAEKPLRIKNSGVKLYSMEELCYYLYNNIYMIEPEFFNQELISFLEKELGLESVAKKLKDDIFRQVSYIKMIETVLEGSFYYSDREMEEIKNIMGEMSQKSVEERMKSRADMLAERGRYEQALKKYRELLGGAGRITDTDILGNIWNNVGVIYAKMFLYNDALCSFQSACDMSEEQEYRDNLICTAILIKDDKILSDVMEKYNISKETADKYKKAIELAEEEVKSSDIVIKEIKALTYSTDRELGSFYADADNVINSWKQEYREQIK